MTYNEAIRELATSEKEKQFGEYLRIPIIAPELYDDILKFLALRSKPGDSNLISVLDYSSNRLFSIIWIHKYGGTYSDYLKE